MKRIKYPTVGDYVLVSKYSDRSPYDAWHVGFIKKVTMLEDGTVLYSVFNGVRSYFKCCWLITKSDGDLIIKHENPSVVKLSNKPMRPLRMPRGYNRSDG